MRLLFNLLNTGLGNNGGSLTLIKSANTLVNLGHDVKIIDSGKNQNTWEKLEAQHIIIKDTKKIPEADVIIGTGIKSVDSTNKSDIKLKCHWIRGWEIWNYSEEKLVKILKGSQTVKIANSICLQNKLKQFGIDSYIIRPGYDFEDYFPINHMRKHKDWERVVIGAIYNEGNKRKAKRADWIFDCFKVLKHSFRGAVSLWMYGNEGSPSKDLVSLYKKDPTTKEKNYIYNNVSIWLSPSCLEGLHIPPAEAMLAEAVPVTTNCEMSGTQDYIIHNQTGIISKNNLIDFIEEVVKLVSDPTKRYQLGAEARKKILSLGDRTTNMKTLVELLENLKGE